jgi:hypothetical protein
METAELLNRIEVLYANFAAEEWRIVLEPHDYADGTTHFTHVRASGDINGDPVEISIAKYVTPELAELLVLTHNNLATLLHLARLGLDNENDDDEGEIVC